MMASNISPSGFVQKCEICNVGVVKYTCPKCNKKYCSSHCYKSREHRLCSETFYREWIQTELRDREFDDEEKEKMMHILKRYREAYVEDTVNDGLSVEDRLASLDLNKADENTIWQYLSEEERSKFKSFIQDERNLESIVPLKQPWWTIAVLNLVTEMDEDTAADLDDVAPRPLFPLNVKKLKNLTSVKPSDCIQYNLVNVLYIYAFLYRFYNCDLADFLEDVVDAFLFLSPVLSQRRNYFSLDESVHDSIRLISSSEFNVPLAFVKSIANDVSSIMQGPSNSKPSTYVLCALHDIKLLFLEFKCSDKGKKSKKDFKKMLFHAIHKVEYFMSWSLDYEQIISDISSELAMMMLPELLTDMENSEKVCETKKQKPIIEEID